MECGIREEQGSEQSGTDTGVQNFTGLFVVTQAHALFEHDERAYAVFREVLHCRCNGFGHLVEAAGVEEELPQVRSAYHLADAGKRASDFGLEQDNQSHDTDTRQVTEQPRDASQFPPLRNEPRDNQEEAAHDHLHGAGAPEQQEHVIQDYGHQEDVQDVGHADIDDVEEFKQYHWTSGPPGKV